MNATRLHDEDMTRAGEYALGLLMGEEARAFEREMAARPELRAAYLAWVEDFAGLAEDVQPQSPPPRVKAALEAELFGVEQKQSRLDWLKNWGAGLAAALVLGAALLFVGLPDDGPMPSYSAEIAAEDGGLIVSAAYREDGRLTLDRRAGTARAGRSLELWFIEGDDAPISLGVLADANITEVVLPEALRGRIATAVFALTDEPLGGSPTGSATGEIVAIGQVSEI